MVLMVLLLNLLLAASLNFFELIETLREQSLLFLQLNLLILDLGIQVDGMQVLL
jgi:hypothetical protein